MKRMDPSGCWQVLLRRMKRKKEKSLYELRLKEPMET